MKIISFISFKCSFRILESMSARDDPDWMLAGNQAVGRLVADTGAGWAWAWACCRLAAV